MLNNDYENFYNWLNNTLKEELPEDVVAINFNLYEDGNSNWSIEFVGTGSFDEEDPDWACDEIITNRETPFRIKCNDGWEKVLDIFNEYLKNYLKDGKFSENLMRYKAIGIGFVDGDITIINHN